MTFSTSGLSGKILGTAILVGQALKVLPVPDTQSGKKRRRRK